MKTIYRRIVCLVIAFMMIIAIPGNHAEAAEVFNADKIYEKNIHFSSTNKQSNLQGFWKDGNEVKFAISILDSKAIISSSYNSSKVSKTVTGSAIEHFDVKIINVKDNDDQIMELKVDKDVNQKFVIINFKNIEIEDEFDLYIEIDSGKGHEFGEGIKLNKSGDGGEEQQPEDDDEKLPGDNKEEGTGGNDEEETGGNDEEQLPGDDDEKLPGDNDEEGTGGNDEEETGGNDEEGTGGNDEEGTGSNDEEGTGSNDEEETGSNDEEETGSNDEEETGSNDEEGTGVNDEEGTESNNEEEPEVNDEESTNDKKDTKKDDGRTGGDGGAIIASIATPLAELEKADHFAYVIGYPEGTVKPNDKITRQEVTMIFYRLLTDESRNSLISETNLFSDMESLSWSNKAVSTLYNANIIKGYPDGTFRPEAAITRAEFATIAAKFDNLEGGNISRLTDIAGHWAEDYIISSEIKGWIKGYPDLTFKPDEDITRAEAVSLINNVLGRSVPAANIHPEAAPWADINETDWYYSIIMEATYSHNYITEDNGDEIWTGLKSNKVWP